MAHKGALEVLARVLIRDRSSRVLACRNRKGNYYYLPGGHVEHGESAQEAATRELMEECGLKCRIGPLRLVTENRFGSRKQVTHEYSLVFDAKVRQAGSDVQSREDHLDFAWLSKVDLKQSDFRPKSIKKWLLALAPTMPAKCEYLSESSVD